MKLPDKLIETIRQATDNENASKMYTVVVLGEQWNKYKEAITLNYADEEGLDKPDEGKARGAFLRSLAGNLADTSYPTLANRMSVFRNVVDRGLYQGNEVISAPVWMYLMRNLKREDGLVELDDLNKRLNWYYENDMPTTRTIEDYVRDNGHDPEWKVLWKRIVRNAEKLVDTPYPKLEKVVQTILFLDKDLVLKREEDA